jgi:hypothetical protein
MTTTVFGEGIKPVEMPTVESDVTPVPMPVVESPSDIPPAPMPTVFHEGGAINLEEIKNLLRAELRAEMDAAVADTERRLAQARQLEQSAAAMLNGEAFERQIHTEDLNVGFAMIDGYTLTANSPAAGSIAWASLHVVLLGVDYTITDGNTNLKYAWFVKPASGTTATLSTSNTLPTLGPGDALIFINNAGTPISVLESSVVYAVGPGAIGNAQLDQSTQTLLTNLQNSDISLQAQLDGTINSYYQATAPWPDGSPSPSGGNVNQGDIWYDSDNGWTYRWTGTTGSPANTWFRIADTDIALVQSKVNTKVTTYLAASTAAPVAPSGGFTTGDMWMVTDQGNLLRRWSGSAWVDVQMGDGAISGVSGAKIGSGISATNVTTGTLTGSLVGTGINATNVTTGTLAGARVGTGVSPTTLTGTGTAPVAAIPTLTPAKLNTAFHMLY